MNKSPKIENDKLFNQIKKAPKCESHNKKIEISDYDSNFKKYSMSKEKFFNVPPKDMNMEEKDKKIKQNCQYNTTNYAEESRLNKKFEENKEKNMRNKTKA